MTRETIQYDDGEFENFEEDEDNRLGSSNDQPFSTEDGMVGVGAAVSW